MKISSIIAEFNPFHNGHKYLAEEVKKDCDGLISVMSGSFVQRGDVALFDKWVRAKAAVDNGVDLVIELPTVYAVSAAERFAYGAVELLSSLNCVDEICFGSENGNINELYDAGKKLFEENAAISEKIKEYMSFGNGFALSRQLAYNGLISGDLLSSPNNILAIEYIKAVLATDFSVKLKTVQRCDNGYHSIDTTGKLASATALRKFVSEKEDYADYIPENLRELYASSSLYTFEKLNDTVIYLLRSMSAKELSFYNGISEGLENKLKECALKYSEIDEIIGECTTKRYTSTRIRRCLTAILLGIKKEDVFLKNSYVRVLAFNDTGRRIINLIKESSALPVIVKTADYKEKNIMLEKDFFATDIAALCTDDEKSKKGGKDYTTPPVYIKS